MRQPRHSYTRRDKGNGDSDTEEQRRVLEPPPLTTCGEQVLEKFQGLEEDVWEKDGREGQGECRPNLPPESKL